MYRGGRPGRLARMLNRATAGIVGRGLGPARMAVLEVPGRRSGRRVACPVVVADHAGGRYLVAMLGEGAGWVANVRAAGGRAALRRGRRERVRLDEVAPQDRAPVLRRYLEVAPAARAHFPVGREAPPAQFEAIAPRYPVFRIHSDPAA
jgi:deazaflavin-dependent oxidoreductase (nitroreductase family)